MRSCYRDGYIAWPNELWFTHVERPEIWFRITRYVVRREYEVAEVHVNGGKVIYEFIGPSDGKVVVLTPGWRFGKDHGGVRELG